MAMWNSVNVCHVGSTLVVVAIRFGAIIGSGRIIPKIKVECSIRDWICNALDLGWCSNRHCGLGRTVFFLAAAAAAGTSRSALGEKSGRQVGFRAQSAAPFGLYKCKGE